MNNNPQKPPSGPPSLQPGVLKWLIQYRASQQQNSMMQSLLMTQQNLALQPMLQFVPPQLLPLQNAIQFQQMVVAMQAGSFFGFPPFLPPLLQAPFVPPVNQTVENAKKSPPNDEKSSTERSLVDKPEKCQDREKKEKDEEQKQTSETEPKESNRMENPKEPLFTVERLINKKSNPEAPKVLPASETVKQFVEPKPKRQRKRKHVAKDEPTSETPKKLSRDNVAKENSVESFESIIVRAKQEAERQRREIKMKEALDRIWFDMPPENEYERFNSSQLKQLKRMLKKPLVSLDTPDKEMPFFEQHRRIFEALRSQKVIIDIEKVEKRREGQPEKDTPSTSASSSPPESEAVDSVFSDEVYQAFDIKTLAALCSMMRESFFNFNTHKANENKARKKNLNLWLPKLNQIIKDSQRVFQRKFDVFLKEVIRKRDQDRREREIELKQGLKPPMISDWKRATSGSNEECMKVLKLFHELSGISFKPTNTDEVVQLRWMSVYLEPIQSDKRRTYLKRVMQRVKRKISLPADYVPGKTDVSTGRLYRIMLEDYNNERKFRKMEQKTGSSFPLESSVGRISKYDMEAFKITIERIKQMDYDEIQELTHRTREFDRELNLLLRLLNEHYSNRNNRKREMMSKNAEVLERFRSVPCMKVFEERIKWITERRLTDILLRVQDTLRALDEKRANRTNEFKNSANVVCVRQNKETKLERVFPKQRDARDTRFKVTENDMVKMERIMVTFKRFVARLRMSPESDRTNMKEKVLQKVLKNERCYQFALDVVSKMEKSLTRTPPVRPISLLERKLARKSSALYSEVKTLPLNWNMEDMGRLVQSLKSDTLRRSVKEARSVRDEVQKRKVLSSKKDSKGAKQAEEARTKNKKVETVETGRLLPCDTVCHTIGSRLNQGLVLKKYAITSEEMRRRIAGFEKLNSSNIALHLRRAKEKNSGELMRSQLKEKGVDTPFNKRQTMRSTNIVALCELEMQDFFKDMKSFCYEYPVQEVADELVTSFLEEDVTNVLRMGSQCDGILKMMYAFSSVVKSVVPPVNGHLPVSSGDKQFNHSMEQFSQATHGFGVQSFQLWVQKSIETFEAMTTHRRLRDVDGNRLTAIPLLEEAIEKTKNVSSDDITKVIEEVTPRQTQL